MKHLRLLFTSCAVVFNFGFATSVNAITTYYSNEATFLANVSNPTLESFEGLTATNTQSSSNLVAGQITVIPGSNTILGVWDNPVNGPHATDGTNFIRANVDLDTASTSVTFSFGIPINAFGINITDFGDVNPGGRLLFTNDAGDSFTVASGALPESNEIFFGLLNTSNNFQSVTFFNENLVDGTGYDEIYSNAVPIPSAVWLFGSGLLGIIGISRRKNQT